MIKEACVFNILEALNAVKLAANRIELCENTTCGGTTPSYGTIKVLKETLDIPIVVMIRPRCGDFVYSDLEFKAMKEDIKLCRRLGVEGIVFGILKDDHEIDIDRTKELLSLADPLKVTFHKAIDETCDIKSSVIKLLDIGVHRILTSGGGLKAEDSLIVLRDLILIAGEKLEIVVAGEVNKYNIDNINDILCSRAYHGRLIVGDLGLQLF
ncbi:copper homeostasis protein CutC [Borrelia miyamotoi]|uniref:PF03932 family protein CutC n=1 Tax=Borrelia miyamotoi TaxID=47466 RepID=A0AAQ2WVT6_9SPIR|nr:copper homeostasis protein CutC [Borrelia miyamotoi]AGT27770.1 copper homeostasis protein CutC [Borrelia miyamotoi LB-2001]AJA58915.1 copper homeostasis protein CutC [Borrelia miyamotoi]AOW96009.1 copper homeostasis protein CutC [Borrelia miyamotoi]QTL83907.1 copper homeostasis protein CutC [Borrelia miyamotoi]WAZ84787.1 copper homeostasis protein CutC [Borrelia miyamotoi]